MAELLVHLSSASVILILFYIFYKTLLSQDTFFRANRIVILLAYILSIGLPFLTVSPKVFSLANVQGSYEHLLQLHQGRKILHAPESSSILYIVFAVYAGGILVRVSLLLAGFFRIVLMIKYGERFIRNHYVLVIPREEVSPFSWWRYIFMSKHDLGTDAEVIERHEALHLKKWHSLDQFLAEIAICLFWFHPIAYLLKYELKNTHEFEVDDALLKEGRDPQSYQMLLLKRAAANNGLNVTSSFSESKIGLRIKMMLRKRSSLASRLKYIGLPIVTAVSILMFANPNLEQEFEGKKITLRSTSPKKPQLPSLYIIDGRESTYQEFEKIEPASIKTISVLEPSEAISAYGNDAVDGAIIVKTK